MAISGKLMPKIDLAACNGSGKCVERCPTGALRMQDGRVAMTRPDLCSYCATCEDVCPTEAIALPFQIVLDSGSQQQ